MLPLAELSDLQDRLGLDLDDTEAKRAAAAIADASALVRDEARQEWSNPSAAPGVVRTIVLKLAERVMRNPDEFVAEGTGPFNVQRDRDRIGSYLLEEEKAILARYRPATRRPLWTQPTTRDECVLGTIWYQDSFGLEPIPYESRDDFGCV